MTPMRTQVSPRGDDGIVTTHEDPRIHDLQLTGGIEQ